MKAFEVDFDYNGKRMTEIVMADNSNAARGSRPPL